MIYGMGERAVVAIAEALEAGIDVKDITWIEGTCYKAKSFEQDEVTALLPSYEVFTGSKDAYCRSFDFAY